jgi:hypothetical protein
MKQISYAKLFNTGNYENERIELVQSYDETLSDEECISDLAVRVENMHKAAHKKAQEAEKAEKAERDKAEKERRLKEIERRKTDLDEEAKRLNAPEPDSDDNDDEED